MGGESSGAGLARSGRAMSEARRGFGDTTAVMVVVGGRGGGCGGRVVGWGKQCGRARCTDAGQRKVGRNAIVGD